jgi:hypothetical protein
MKPILTYHHSEPNMQFHASPSFHQVDPVAILHRGAGSSQGDRAEGHWHAEGTKRLSRDYMINMEAKKASIGKNALWKIFANLRGVAIIGVLINHAFLLYSAYASNMGGIHNLNIEGFSLGFNAPVITFGLQFQGFCVPLFLFLAGYSAALSPQSWLSIGQRIKNLMLPFIFWSVFAWIWFAFWAWYGRSPQYSWSVTDFLTRLITGNTQGGYFFFIQIFLLYILFRWIVPLVKQRPTVALFIAFAIQISCMVFNYGSVIGFPLQFRPAGYRDWYQVMVIHRYDPLLYAAFTVLGIYAAFNDQRIKKLLDLPPWVFMIATGVSGFALILENGYLFHLLTDLGYSSISSAHFSKSEWIMSYELWGLVVIFAVSAWFRRRIPVSRLYKRINNNAFELFLLNGPCLLLLDRVFRLFNKIGLSMVFKSSLLIIVIFAYELLAPALFCFLVERFLPKVRRFVLG